MAPAKGKKGKPGNSKKTNSRAPEPTVECVLPLDIISNILSRVSVKDLLRFRCVDKPWRKLISEPHFIKTHLQVHDTHFKLGSPTILISTIDAKSSHHVLSLYKYGQQAVQELENPYPVFLDKMYVVGPCNGIFCLFQPNSGDVITLWNPATRQSRLVPLLDNKQLTCDMVSVGMAFDPQEYDNLFILRIFCEEVESSLPSSQLEICSTKTNFTWKKLKNEVGFNIFTHTSLPIVEGVPYWLTLLTDEKEQRPEVLVRFDLGREVFEKLSFPAGVNNLDMTMLEDSVCLLSYDSEKMKYVDVWVLGDDDSWSKKCRVGPFSGIARMVYCSRSGDFVGENKKGELLLFDPVTASVKEKFSVGNPESRSHIIFDYSESLVLIDGMQPVKKQDPRDRKNVMRFLKKKKYAIV